MYQDAPKPYYPPPGRQMPTDQNYPPPGQQMPTDQNYSPSAPPKPPQQYGAQYQYAQPSQQVPWQQYGQLNPQQQYAQPDRQMPCQNYQQQQPPQPMPYQYYPQNTAPQYNPIVAPPIQPSNPHMNVPLQQWSSELFDCAQDPENCLITACCPCITFGQIAEITDRGMTSCAISGLIYVLLLYFTGCHWLYSFMYRQKLRAQYSLAEDPCHDCLVHAFCDPCALCQEYRELKNRGFNMQLGWAQNMQMQAQMGAAPGVPPSVQTMKK